MLFHRHDMSNTSGRLADQVLREPLLMSDERGRASTARVVTNPEREC